MVSLKKIWFKIFDKNKYYKEKYDQLQKKKEQIYKNKVEFFLQKIDNSLKSKKEISFLHSGHLGDIINSLPLIKEISKTKNATTLFSQKKKYPYMYKINHILSVNFI
jgi:hypothetical protein